MENLKSMTNDEKNKEIAEKQWESWIVDLTDQEQPTECNIDDVESCENCGS